MGSIGGRAVACRGRRGPIPLRRKAGAAGARGGRGGADGDGARLRAALAVENFTLVAGGNDALHGGQWRADNADAADELVGAAIDVDSTADEGNHLEGLRRAALRDGKAGGDVLKVETVRLVLLFGFVDQLFAQIRIGNALG